MTKNLRSLSWGAYGVAFLLVLIPIADSLLGVWPLRVGEVTWRFGAVGLFSRAIMTPLIGLLIALITAVYMEHRLVGRGVAVVSFVGVLLALGGVGFFALDAIQTRAQVRPEAAAAFDTAAVVAVVKYLFGAIVALLLGIGGWRATRKGRGRRETGSAAAQRLLIPRDQEEGVEEKSSREGRAEGRAAGGMALSPDAAGDEEQ